MHANGVLYRHKEQIKQTEENKMAIETVRELKGYKVQRYAGTRGHFFVNIREGKGFREFHAFKTIKAAVEFIEKAL